MQDEGCGSDGGGDFISAHRNDDGWRCADCRTDWPCLVFRRRLRALYADDLARLRTFMRHFRDRAAVDLDNLTPAQLDTRFLGWIDRPHPRPRPRRSI